MQVIGEKEQTKMEVNKKKPKCFGINPENYANMIVCYIVKSNQKICFCDENITIK